MSLGFVLMKYLLVLKMHLLFMVISLDTQLYIWCGARGSRGEYVNVVVCVWRRLVTQNRISERCKAREGWVTTLLVPPLAIRFCPNNSRLKHHAETFHISSLRSFWQLTSCSLLFFAMMAWVSHRAFSLLCQQRCCLLFSAQSLFLNPSSTILSISHSPDTTEILRVINMQSLEKN